MIPIQWSERTSIPNLSQLVQNYRERGGSIIEYQRVWSLVFFSSSSPRFEWVPPSSSRHVAGIKHALFCLFFGWWSPAGLFWTLPAVINNFLGGVDVSHVLANPPPLPGETYDPAAIGELVANRRRQGIIGLLSLTLVIGVIVSFIVRDFTGRPSRRLPSPVGYNWMLEHNGGDSVDRSDFQRSAQFGAEWVKNWRSTLPFFTAELSSSEPRRVKTSMVCLTNLAMSMDMTQLSGASHVAANRAQFAEKFPVSKLKQILGEHPEYAPWISAIRITSFAEHFPATKRPEAISPK